MNKMTVVGSGVMGKGIAYAFATGGFEVQLNDLNQEILNNATHSIRRPFDTNLEEDLLTIELHDHAKSNMRYETDSEKPAQASDLVTEAVLDKIVLKI